MKTVLICLGVLWACFWGYAYAHNPAGCQKIGTDVVVLVRSLLPGGDINSKDGAAVVADAEPPVPIAPIPKTTPTIVAPSYTAPAPVKGWAPPNPLPEQPNWKWTTTWGKEYQDVVITRVDPDLVSINHSQGAASIPISTLPPDLQKQLNYDPTMATVIGSAVSGKLINPDGTPWVNTTPIRHYAVYFSAHWCPPCRAFTPQLVEWYKQYKPSHPDFELILVSSDEDAAHMAAYRTTTGMTFPAVRFDAIAASGLKKYCGRGIPCLVLLKSDGQVVLDTNVNGTYMGPASVLEGIPGVVGK